MRIPLKTKGRARSARVPPDVLGQFATLSTGGQFNMHVLDPSRPSVS